MTYRARQRWPAVAAERRFVIPSRTERGEACTVIVLREEDGPLKLYFHGARQTSMAPDPTELAELVEALQAAGTR